MASNRKSPISQLTKIQGSTINKNCCYSSKHCTNVLQKLYLREIKEIGQHFTFFKKIPRRLAFKLSSMVNDFDLQFGYIFLGFTKDSQFMISYTMQIEEDLPAGFLGYVYKLQWWLFIPYQPLKKVSEVRLFGEAEITQELHLTVCQWPSDESLILIHGVCCSSEATEQQLKQCFITVTPTPPAIFCSDCQCNFEIHSGTSHSPASCLKHGFSVHTKYCVIPPFPAFLPNISLKIDKTVVINTGDSLIVFSVFLNKNNSSIKFISPSENQISNCSSGDMCVEDNLISVQNSKDEFDKLNNFKPCNSKEFVTDESVCQLEHKNLDVSFVPGLCSGKSKFTNMTYSAKTCSKPFKNGNHLCTAQEISNAHFDRKEETDSIKRDTEIKDRKFGCGDKASSTSVFSTDSFTSQSSLVKCDTRNPCSDTGDCTWAAKNTSEKSDSVNSLNSQRAVIMHDTEKLIPSDSLYCSSSETKELSNSLWQMAVTGAKTWKSDVGNSIVKPSFLQNSESKKSFIETIDTSNNGYKYEPIPHKDFTECLQEVSANIVNSTYSDETLKESSSYDESLKENIKPLNEAVKDLHVSKTKCRGIDTNNENKLMSNVLLTSPSLSTDQGSSSGSNNATPPHSCITVLERVFVECKDLGVLFEEEDNSTSSSYNNCLPLDVYGSNSKKLRYLSVNELPKIDCDSITIRQQNFDVEQFIHEIAQCLCSNAGKRFFAINDYDIQLIDVHPDTAEVIVLAVMLVRTSLKTKEPGNSQNDNGQQIYQTGFTFIWNILTGNYFILDTQEFEETVKNETNEIWNPAFLISEEIKKKGYVPQSFMKSVNILTNDAVLRGKSLDIIWEPYHHLAVLL